MSNIGKILAQNVVALRKQRGLTQENLAEITGMSVTGIAFVETKRTWPSPGTIKKIANALGVPEERLFVPPEFIPEATIGQALAKVCSDLGFEAPKPKRRNEKQDV